MDFPIIGISQHDDILSAGSAYRSAELTDFQQDLLILQRFISHPPAPLPFALQTGLSG
jgi:hypothetical protein